MSPAYRRATLSTYRLGLSNPTYQPIEAPKPPTTLNHDPPAPRSTYTPSQQAAITAAFTLHVQAEFDEDYLFGKDNAKALLASTLAINDSIPPKSYPHLRTIRHPSLAANWLRRGFRQAQREDAAKRQSPQLHAPSDKGQNCQVTLHDETDSQRTKRKRWLQSQVQYESQRKYPNTATWNLRIPSRFQEKGSSLVHHGINFPRKRPKKDLDDARQPSTKTLAASAATADDEAKAAKLRQQGFKPVMVTKAPYRPKEK
jgi:hypothetical protein